LSVAAYLTVAFATLAPAAGADEATVCPPVVVGEELRTVPELVARNGKLQTTFSVEMKTLCVPVQNGGQWIGTPMELRTYVYPDPATGQLKWGFPGPTLRVRKPTPPAKHGDSWSILLVNQLPPDSGHVCESACPAGTQCPSDVNQLPDPTKCPSNKDPLCCCWVDRNQTFPDCFHGDNTTNLHFHGTHVSPQPPQDYVLLELRPALPAGKLPADEHAVHRGGIIAYGQYQYAVDPLPETQAEGTHWYHPHKHGSVSLQVANGMPGALIIEGPFDDWLRGYYGGTLVEKLLVLQEIQAATNLYADTAKAPPTLVNGQVSPTVTMAPGEVQRWRFVDATMKGTSQISINFPAGVTVKQIAMDGVQFARENYQRQPLFDPANPSTFRISPGNRADFLVQAPATPGTLNVTHEVVAEVAAEVRERLKARDEALAPGAPLAPLVRLRVREAKPQGEAKEEGAAAVATGFPPVDQWPPMPWYLQDIPPNQVKNQVNLIFSMADHTGAPSGQGNPATMFFINDIQYDPDCVNVTTALDTADQWNISNTSPLAHPFHIHTNPFQVVRNGTTSYQAPYVWQDTIGLPTGTPEAPGSVELRQRYLEFTGEYVLHCHFLGHEDRGMMFGVQTVCKDDPTKFGQAKADGSPECVPGNLIPAAPQCPTSTDPSPAAAASR
jgi:FtsP/CotA-like multicopper oxidase with cupredoxin domain